MMCMYQVRDCYPMLQRVAVKNCKYKLKSFNSNTLEATIFDG